MRSVPDNPFDSGHENSPMSRVSWLFVPLLLGPTPALALDDAPKSDGPAAQVVTAAQPANGDVRRLRDEIDALTRWVKELEDRRGGPPGAAYGWAMAGYPYA